MGNYPVIAVTVGEPAGVGADIVAHIAARQIQTLEMKSILVLVSDPQLIQDRARIIGLDMELPTWSPDINEPGIYCLPVKLKNRAIPGSLDPANSAYVIETLTIAARGCLDKKFHAMATGPVHKGIINEAGIPFTGHTEFLEELTGSKQVVMMLASDQMRVALATTHLQLKLVAESITRPRLTEVIKVLHRDLGKFFGLKTPRIAVCGLNPHAGEGGHLGSEEIDIIEPVISELNRQGCRVQGPFSADTIFTEKNLRNYDVVLAMFHDQGLPVIKHAGFGKTVNVTLGLPFLRTSVDHGTALHLAGKGDSFANHIDINSMRLAIKMATDMVQKH